jgi:hypothetical protein
MKHWSDSITKRGWFVIGILLVTAIFVFSHATRDVCWVGLDIVSCTALLEGVIK